MVQVVIKWCAAHCKALWIYDMFDPGTRIQMMKLSVVSFCVIRPDLNLFSLVNLELVIYERLKSYFYSSEG